MSNEQKKYKHTLSPVFFINDDLSISAGEFKSASDFAERFVLPDEDSQPIPAELESVSLRIPAHLHSVIKSNSQCFGMTKTQFMIQALEIGINEIYNEMKSHGMESISTDGYEGAEDS